MALVMYWYDFVCFGIVAAAVAVALWMQWRRELATTCDDNVRYQSLLVARPDINDHRAVHALMPRNHVSSSQLWTSCWRGVHPGWLLATRFISFLVMGGLLLTDFLDWDATIFVYYTEWTFLLALVYFALGTVISAYGCWLSSKNPAAAENAKKSVPLKRDVEDIGTAATSITYMEDESTSAVSLQSHSAEEAILERAGFWGYLMQIIYQTCAGAIVLTDIVFWCLIVPFLSNTHLGLNALMGCIHSFNAVFIVLDTLLNNLPFPWFRIAYFVQWSCIYAIFQWIIHACGFTWWPYSFLELDTPWAPLWYFLVAVIHIPCYGVYALIFKAKNTIFPRLFPRAFVRSF
ncbi:hypothetical protein OIU84_016354 [Salix udensis]|uniref:Uncharacterized protein n=1 Tax=Salix udensis TaxID=889485 RepID=A0AAD6NQA4_9ROSI|nr:hypothetical protein OIU84_016354 [Salix udensis]